MDAHDIARREANRAYRAARVPNPITHRVPREKAYIVASLEPPTKFETALKRLRDRVKETKHYYTLDGRPCNATDIMKAAGFDN